MVPSEGHGLGRIAPTRAHPATRTLRGVNRILPVIFLAACTASPAATQPAAAPAPTRPAVKTGPPLGLKWGASPDEAKAQLAGRLNHVDDGTHDGATVQTYAGEFSGFAGSSVKLVFREGRLVSAGAMLVEKDPVPASKRFEQMVAKMTEAHGPPLHKEPAPAFPRDMLSLYDMLDDGLKREDWKASAEWRYGDTRATVAVFVAPPDRHGSRKLTPAFVFTGPGFQPVAEKSDL